MAWLTAICALGGLCIGSFLNVVVWRVPRGESVVSPPSHCPKCSYVLRASDNVPVLSWLVLRGRCRSCRLAISARYPVVEAATGVLFALSAVVAIAEDALVLLPLLLILVSGTLSLALIAHDVRRVDRSVLGVTAALMALTLAAAVVF